MTSVRYGTFHHGSETMRDLPVNQMKRVQRVDVKSLVLMAPTFRVKSELCATRVSAWKPASDLSTHDIAQRRKSFPANRSHHDRNSPNIHQGQKIWIFLSQADHYPNLFHHSFRYTFNKSIQNKLDMRGVRGAPIPLANAIGNLMPFITRLAKLQ